MPNKQIRNLVLKQFRGTGHVYVRYVKPAYWYNERHVCKALYCRPDLLWFIAEYGRCWFSDPDSSYIAHPEIMSHENFPDNNDNWFWGDYWSVKAFFRIDRAWGTDENLRFDSEFYNEHKKSNNGRKVLEES